MDKGLRSDPKKAPLWEKESAGYGFYIFLAVLIALFLGFRVWWTDNYGGV